MPQPVRAASGALRIAAGAADEPGSGVQRGRRWTDDGADERAAPLCDQADVEAEANTWAGLWSEGGAALRGFDAVDSPLLEPLLPRLVYPLTLFEPAWLDA